MFAILTASALLGIASSAHCIAMCGPLVVAGCARAKGGGRSTFGYLGGRLVSYAVVGGIAGSIGGPLVVAASTSREVRIAMGWLLAASVAWVAIKWMRKPAKTGLIGLRTKPAAPSRVQLLLARLVPARGIGLGLATGLFPCGALASALVVAATTGTAYGGALAMSAFALASAPALLALALFGKNAVAWVGTKAWIEKARPAMGVALLGLAAWLGVSPLLGGHHRPEGAACSCDAEHGAEVAGPAATE